MAKTRKFVPAFMLSALAGCARASRAVKERKKAARDMKREAPGELFEIRPGPGKQANKD